MHNITANRRLTGLLLALLDALVLMAAGLAAAWLRFGANGFGQELEKILAHPGFIAYAVLVQLALATTFDLYRPVSWRTSDYLFARLIALAVGMVAALAVGVYAVPAWRFGRGLLALTLLTAIPTHGVVRFLWMMASALPAPRRAILIGNGPIVGALETELASRPSAPIEIIRHVPVPTSGDAIDLPTQELEGADLVIVASLAHSGTVDALAALNFRGTPVVDAAGAYAALTGRIPVRQVDSRWFIATGDFSSLAGSPFHHLQRVLDLCGAVAMLVLTSPALLAAALAVLVSDGPPVLYRQPRVGRFGRTFTVLKLRTMEKDSERRGPEFTERRDRRVLPVGRLLRRWRIDELPQLLNVLRGEMSLVGPRPERPDVAARLEREIPFFAFRYSVRPGLTGWAQVNLRYCRDNDDHLAKLEFDLYSLRHHGPAMYVIVLLRTLGALVFRPQGR